MKKLIADTFNIPPNSCQELEELRLEYLDAKAKYADALNNLQESHFLIYFYCVEYVKKVTPEKMADILGIHSASVKRILHSVKTYLETEGGVVS